VPRPGPASPDGQARHRAHSDPVGHHVLTGVGAGPPRRSRKDWYLSGATAHAASAAAAADAGVTILAGTDSRPHGRVADEVRALAAAGLRPHDALAAASWAARSYLGLSGLTNGAPADVVVYDEDPCRDLSQLDKPQAIVLRGRLTHRR
jgi:imidazolonepropionase-like amidohydrolase